MAVTNAYVVYKANTTATSLHRRLTQKEFRLQLASKLCANTLATRKGRGRAPSSSDDRLKGKHFLYRGSVRKRCAVSGHKKTTTRGKG